MLVVATIRRARMRDDEFDDQTKGWDMDLSAADLLVALGLSALIGAAGGWDYAGILGSKKRGRSRSQPRDD
jgi:hypothetical protein